MPSKFDLFSWLSLGATLVRGPGRSHEIYLTFDDGPHPIHTPELLETLGRHGAKGTFFMIGNHIRQFPDVVRAIHAAGHELANHSNTHPWLDTLHWREQSAEISVTEQELSAVDGKRMHHFRPPHGRVTATCLWLSLWRRLQLTLWSIDSLDYRLGEVEVTERLRKMTVRGGDILLFHDDAAVAARVLEQLLPEWRSRGLVCAVLPR